MRCLHPLEVPIIANGKRTNSYHLVPCGKCVECLRQKQQDWIIRLNIEHKFSKECVFLTFTYDDDHLPMIGEYSTLVKNDLQKYFKRLRKRFASGSIRFFACGEYGSHTHRSHYHAIIFYRGEDSVDLAAECQKDWHDGFTYVGTVNEASIAYVTKYTLKSLSYPEHSLKPFVLMSRRPAIGAEYLDDIRNVDFHADHPFFVKPGGLKQRLPRYYADKLGVVISSVDDLLEKQYFKRHPEASDLDFYKWKAERVKNHEAVVAHRLRNKDIL